MKLFHLFSTPPMSEDEKDQREELDRARGEKRAAREKLRKSLKDGHELSTKLTRTLAEAIRQTEELEDSGEIDLEELEDTA